MARVKLLGPMARYHYRNRTYHKGVVQSVRTEVADYLVTVGHFSVEYDENEQAKRSGGKKGGVEITIPKKAWKGTPGSFKRKSDAITWASQEKSAQLSAEWSLKKMNRACVRLESGLKLDEGWDKAKRSEDSDETEGNPNFVEAEDEQGREV